MDPKYEKEISGMIKVCEKEHIRAIIIAMDEDDINSAEFQRLRMTKEQAKTVMRMLADQ